MAVEKCKIFTALRGVSKMEPALACFGPEWSSIEQRVAAVPWTAVIRENAVKINI